MSGIRWKTLSAFSAVYIIWGSTYLGILIGIKTMPPFFLTAMRFLLAGLVLIIWRFTQKDRIPSLESIAKNSLVGALTLVGGVGSVGWAEQYIPSSVAAIVVTAIPFWFVLFDRKQWSFYFNNKIILTGLFFGFAGVAILVGFSHPAGLDQSLEYRKIIGFLVIICGGIAWTTGSLYSKYKVMGNSLLMDAAIQFLSAGIISFGISGFLGEWKGFSLQHVSLESLIALFYLFTMGSLVAYLAYLWLIKNRPAAQVSSYVYVNPVIAVLLGALLAHEIISWTQVLSLVIILIGVVMVNVPKYRHHSEQH
jgi:drug/metabolite transporter (DMT)-like permease